MIIFISGLHSGGVSRKGFGNEFKSGVFVGKVLEIHGIWLKSHPRNTPYRMLAPNKIMLKRQGLYVFYNPNVDFILYNIFLSFFPLPFLTTFSILLSK